MGYEVHFTQGQGMDEWKEYVMWGTWEIEDLQKKLAHPYNWLFFNTRCHKRYFMSLYGTPIMRTYLICMILSKYYFAHIFCTDTWGFKPLPWSVRYSNPLLWQKHLSFMASGRGMRQRSSETKTRIVEVFSSWFSAQSFSFASFVILIEAYLLLAGSGGRVDWIFWYRIWIWMLPTQLSWKGWW